MVPNCAKHLNWQKKSQILIFLLPYWSLHSCHSSNKILAAIEIAHIAQKMKLFIKDFFSKCDQIFRKLRIWSHLQKKFLMENSSFWAVLIFSLAI